MEPFETFEHAGLTCELHYDEEPSSPADWDQLGTLYGFRSLTREYGFTEAADGEAEDAFERGGSALLVRYLRTARGEYAVPFRFVDYGSGGARIHATSIDDERASGYIATTRKRFEELCGAWGYKPADYDGTPEQWLEHTLADELESWNNWVQGNVYGYVVRDQRGDVLESVWGFYPDGDGLDYLRAEVKSAAEGCAADIAEQRRKAAIGWATAHRILSAGWSK